MRFLCDVHISYKVVKHLKSAGFEVVHVNEILDKWQTKDGDICSYADENDLIVLTKDADFRNSFLINNTPKKPDWTVIPLRGIKSIMRGFVEK